MTRKRYKGNKSRMIIVTLILTIGLMGTSYAYWTQQTTVTTTVGTGDIEATANVANGSFLRVCVNMTCADNSYISAGGRDDFDGEFHNVTPAKIVIKNIGSVPAAVKSAEVVSFSYYKPKYQERVWKYLSGREKKEWSYVGGSEKIVICPKAGEMKGFVSANSNDSSQVLKYDGTPEEFRNAIKDLIKKNGSSVEVKKIVNKQYLDWRLNSHWEESREDESYNFGEVSIWDNWHQRYDNCSLACIDPTNEGSITLKVTYTQFNMVGWEKEIQETITVPIKWVRFVDDWGGKVNKRLPDSKYDGNAVSIFPGNEREYI